MKVSINTNETNQGPDLPNPFKLNTEQLERVCKEVQDMFNPERSYAPAEKLTAYLSAQCIIFHQIHEQYNISKYDIYELWLEMDERMKEFIDSLG